LNSKLDIRICKPLIDMNTRNLPGEPSRQAFKACCRDSFKIFTYKLFHVYG
jgi:hypothetical protein